MIFGGFMERVSAAIEGHGAEMETFGFKDGFLEGEANCKDQLRKDYKVLIADFKAQGTRCELLGDDSGMERAQAKASVLESILEAMK